VAIAPQENRPSSNIFIKITMSPYENHQRQQALLGENNPSKGAHPSGFTTATALLLAAIEAPP